MIAIEVLDPGPLALVQDAGRPGLSRLGVGASGAMDRGALALANRLAGNPQHAAGLELLFGAARFRAEERLWIALTGAWVDARVDGRPVEPHTATAIPAGATLDLGSPTHGARVYLAVRGGIDLPPVLGSRSRDTLAALGPAPLAAGARVPVGPEPALPVPAVDVVPVGPPPDGEVTLGIRPGPRRDRFADSAWAALLEAAWTVTPRSDRTGIRLEGPGLARLDDRELPSEAMIPGAMQVSPDGAPTILGPDHPVTGGYPVPAVVVDASLDALAQLRPGQPVRFRLATGRG